MQRNSSEAAIAASAAYAPSSSGRAASAPSAGVVVAASGATVRTSDGRELIDLASGGFGYSHPRVLERVKRQVQALPLSSRHFLSRPLAELVERLAHITPGALEVTFPCNSSSEAVEGALKLARGYWPGRTRVVATTMAHHGSTLGALAVSDTPAPLRDAPVDVARVPYDDLKAAERAIDRNTAAVIVQPLATGSGAVLPRPGYLAGLRALATRADALLIVDEVITGLGRTGARFAIEDDGVLPDVIVLGDALGGGAVPVGAYVATKAVNDRVYRRRDPVLHASTTGGNPAACAAALAVLDTLEEEHLELSCAARGEQLGQAIAGWRRRHPDLLLRASGRGLLISIRVPDGNVAYALQRAALDAGVLLRAGRGWIELRPPLTIAAAELERGVAAIERAIEAVAHEPAAPAGAVCRAQPC
jgi:putrescine aminotransferase